MIIFNQLNWWRNEPVEMDIQLDIGARGLVIADSSGIVPTQLEDVTYYKDGSIKSAKVIFIAGNVPPMGYKLYWIVPTGESDGLVESYTGNSIENQFYKIETTPDGLIKSIFDKESNKEMLKDGNELIGLSDVSNNIEPEFIVGTEWKMRGQPSNIEVIKGPVRSKLIITGDFIEGSERKQIVSLYDDLKIIEFETYINWTGKKNIQVRLYYPFDVNNPSVYYGVPFGYARIGDEMPYSSWLGTREVQKWADVEGEGYGVTFASKSIAMDFDGSSISPILLRTVVDCLNKSLYFTSEGNHEFQFWVNSHKDDWRESNSYRLGWELNNRLIPFITTKHKGQLPSEMSFINVEPDNVIVSAVKKGDDESIIMRYYESEGNSTNVGIKMFKSMKSAWLTDLLESREKELKNITEISTPHNSIITIKMYS
jgi:alpha-mannosidase